MTDNQLSKLLILFHKIEELMVANGANQVNSDGAPTSFSDKVKSFDKFKKEPKNPGDIGYKFYLKGDSYHIKDQYDYEYGIEDELRDYEEYKLYKKQHWQYRNTVLDGNYYTLKKIGHERNQLLHIFDYEVNNYTKFIKICNSMISYLQEPNKKPFFGYGKFKSDDTEVFNDNSTTRDIENKKSKIIILDEIFDMIINIKTVSTFFIVLISIGLFDYLMIGTTLEEYKLTDNYLVLLILSIIIYNSKKIFIYLRDALMVFFEFLFLLLLGLLELILPYVFGAIALYALFTWFSSNPSKDKYTRSNDVKEVSTVKNVARKTTITSESNNNLEPEKVYIESVDDVKFVKIQKKEPCNYYYVQTNNLNVRSKSTSRSSVVDKVNLNEKICVTKKETPWYYILDKGWVHSKYLSNINPNVSLKKNNISTSDKVQVTVEKTVKPNTMNGKDVQGEKIWNDLFKRPS